MSKKLKDSGDILSFTLNSVFLNLDFEGWDICHRDVSTSISQTEPKFLAESPPKKWGDCVEGWKPLGSECLIAESHHQRASVTLSL